MATRNPSIHGNVVKPSELSSRIRGLQARYDMNKQLIGWLRTYHEVARLLEREYSQSRAYPECCTVFNKSKAVAVQQGLELRGVQDSLQKELDALRGQLTLWEAAKGAEDAEK